MTQSESLEERTEKRKEARVRQSAKRRGFYVCKARGQTHINNHGQYQLVHAYHNTVKMGLDYDSSINEIEDYLRDKPIEK